jgi:predicted AlkP superfamily phosphohydrolase/phosphomutase
MIGLDGETWDLLDPMLRRGIMPNLKKLLDDGSRGNLESIFPPITAPAWSSVYTGTNPGKHGIYDFMRRVADGYRITPTDASRRDGKSIFRLVSDNGAQAFALNAPLTFPPEEFDGIMLPGIPTPGLSISPGSLIERFRDAVPDFEPWPEDMRHLVRTAHHLYRVAPDYVEKTVASYRFAAGELPNWRLGFVHFQVTDMAMHFAWEDQDLLDAVHAAVDKGIGEIMADLPEKTAVIIMSDHGHGPLHAHMHMNEWLRANGYLKFKRNPFALLKTAMFRVGLTPTFFYNLSFRIGLGKAVRSMVHKRKNLTYDLLRKFFLSFEDVDWSRTRAYSYGNVGQVYFNVKGREPNGIVNPGPELEQEMEALRDRLAELRHPVSGVPIAREIVRGTEIYHGGREDEAPDLLLVPYDFTWWAYAENEFGSSKWFTSEPSNGFKGHHRMEGIIGVSRHSAAAGVQLDATLLDIAPTILALLKLPIPSYMDGRALSEAFAPDLELQAATSEEAEIAQASGSGYNKEEEALVAQRLEDLGYL